MYGLHTISAIWNWGDNTPNDSITADINGLSVPAHNYAQPGLYIITLSTKDSGNNTVCTSSYSASVNIQNLQPPRLFTTNITQNEITKQDVLVFPNPAQDIIYIKGIQGKSKLYLFDIYGNLLNYKENFDNFDISRLTKGTYILKIVDNNGNNIKKFIK